MPKNKTSLVIASDGESDDSGGAPKAQKVKRNDAYDAIRNLVEKRSKSKEQEVALEELQPEDSSVFSPPFHFGGKDNPNGRGIRILISAQGHEKCQIGTFQPTAKGRHTFVRGLPSMYLEMEEVMALGQSVLDDLVEAFPSFMAEHKKKQELIFNREEAAARSTSSNFKPRGGYKWRGNYGGKRYY